MTTGNANPNPAAPASAQPNTPQSSQGVPSADFDAAVGREQAAAAGFNLALSPAEIKSQADKVFNDKSSAYWTGSGPDHDAQVALVFKAREIEAAAEGNAPAETMGTMQRLNNRAMNLGDILPKEALANPKIIDGDVEMKHLVTWADNEGVSTPILCDLLAEFANHGGSLGPLSERSMDSMAAKFRGRLRDDQIALLRKWAVAELNPALAREAASASRRRGR